jgi:hypothetical protein
MHKWFSKKFISLGKSGCYTWPVLDHPQSSAPGLLLLPRSSSLPNMSHLSPTQHETSKHNFSHEIKVKGRTTKMSRIQIQTSACRWLITIKLRNWPLDFSIEMSWCKTYARGYKWHILKNNVTRLDLFHTIKDTKSFQYAIQVHDLVCWL